MKITWHGHACFEVESPDGTVIFDPYEKGYFRGLTLPEIYADAVICSHGHGDHSAAEEVSLTGNTYTAEVARLASFHDERQGALRGKNLCTVIETDGLRICHMGDIGHQPEAPQEFGNIDILMLPVGGKYTVDAQGAKQIADTLAPKIIIPMHYKCGDRGLTDVRPVDDFLALYPQDAITRLDSNRFDTEADACSKVLVFKLPPR